MIDSGGPKNFSQERRWTAYLFCLAAAACLGGIVLLPPESMAEEIDRVYIVRALQMAIISFALASVLTPAAIFAANKLGILDEPTEARKIHKAPMPLLGGVAIYAALAVTIIYNFHFSLQLKGVALGGTVMMLVGLIDDVRPLSSRLRLLAQLAATAILIRHDVCLTFLPETGWGHIGRIALTAFWVVGIVNAFNFIDGMDGLATGLAAIAAMCFFAIAFQTRQAYLAFLTIALFGSCLGFLPYNFHRARIFLGSAGSNFLGFTLAGIAVMGGWAAHRPLVSFSVPVLILGVLIYDMIHITVDRILKGKVTSFREWTDYVGRDHFHHRLLRLGLSQRQAALLIYFISGCLGIGAIVLRSNAGNAVLLLIQASIILSVVTVLINVNPSCAETDERDGPRRDPEDPDGPAS